VADLRHYRFTSIWHAPATIEEVFEALRDLKSYPAWWQEVKEVRNVGNDVYRLRCRSFLPYDLIFETRQSVQDAGSGVLEATMTGDLEGFSRWTIKPDAGGTVMRFDEEVVTNKRSLNVLAPVARPAFKANHTIMMRHGQAGLLTFLAGLKLGRTLPPSA
jgi:uncharacterized protein YndB with AHSA1/START domain